MLYVLSGRSRLKINCNEYYHSTATAICRNWIKKFEKFFSKGNFCYGEYCKVCYNQHTPTLASGYVVLKRWLQSALIPFVTAQASGY